MNRRRQSFPEVSELRRPTNLISPPGNSDQQGPDKEEPPQSDALPGRAAALCRAGHLTSGTRTNSSKWKSRHCPGEVTSSPPVYPVVQWLCTQPRELSKGRQCHLSWFPTPILILCFFWGTRAKCLVRGPPPQSVICLRIWGHNAQAGVAGQSLCSATIPSLQNRIVWLPENAGQIGKACSNAGC